MMELRAGWLVRGYRLWGIQHTALTSRTCAPSHNVLLFPHYNDVYLSILDNKKIRNNLIIQEQETSEEKITQL